MHTPKGPLADLLPPADTPVATDPVDLLGWILGLRGTVHISALLDDCPPPARSSDAASGYAPDNPLWRLGHIRAVAMRPLRSPFRGRHALADAGRMREALAAGGMLGRRRRRNIDGVASEAAGAFHAVIGNRIAIARAGVAELREQLRPWFQSLGPTAAYLERLDGAIREHTELRTRQLFERLPAALHRRFADQLWDHVQTLPSEPRPRPPGTDEPHDSAELEDRPDDIAAWYRPGGWIAEHVLVCRRSLLAVCRHEERSLEGLVTAARQLATATETQSS